MGSKIDKGGQDAAPEAAVRGTGRRARHEEVDDETLRRCIAGDSGAERIVLSIHQKRVASFLRARWPKLTVADLEDLTQEVLEHAFDRGRPGSIASFVPPSDGGPAQVSTWLCQIARHLASDWHRSRKRQVETVALERADDIPSSASPQRDSENTERAQALDDAMAGLSEEHREILLLRVKQGKSYEEIARICEIPENTVKSRLNRARIGLKQALERNQR
jgi:RNA polymerase sigma-70 factor, ECF subfamily